MNFSAKSNSYDRVSFISSSSDAVEVYFECITTCSLDDGDCVSRCVQQLKDTQN